MNTRERKRERACKRRYAFSNQRFHKTNMQRANKTGGKKGPPPSPKENKIHTDTYCEMSTRRCHEFRRGRECTGEQGPNFVCFFLKRGFWRAANNQMRLKFSRKNINLLARKLKLHFCVFGLSNRMLIEAEFKFFLVDWCVLLVCCFFCVLLFISSFAFDDHWITWYISPIYTYLCVCADFTAMDKNRAKQQQQQQQQQPLFLDVLRECNLIKTASRFSCGNKAWWHEPTEQIYTIHTLHTHCTHTESQTNTNQQYSHTHTLHTYSLTHSPARADNRGICGCSDQSLGGKSCTKARCYCHSYW